VIENVERFRAELQTASLVNHEFLQQRHIEHRKAGKCSSR